jgi:hypothetical protein
MIMASNCQITLRWLTAEEGDRKLPFMGGRYVPTVRFAGEQDQFSVVVDFPGKSIANPTKGTLRLLNADLVNIGERVVPGAELEVMEGLRVVAQCVVESVHTNTVAAAW